MHYAARLGLRETCKWIYENSGRDNNMFTQQNLAGNTPLHFALFEEKKNVVEWILQVYPECKKYPKWTR